MQSLPIFGVDALLLIILLGLVCSGWWNDDDRVNRKMREKNKEK